MKKIIFSFFLSATMMASGYLWLTPMGLDERGAHIPIDNIPTVERVLLGKKLFFDKNLSLSGSVSCATCHQPEKSFTDGKVVAEGLKKGTRNTPSILNRVYGLSQSWDGKFHRMEDQVRGPLLDPKEMGNPSEESIVKRLSENAEYKNLFKKAYEKDVTFDLLAKAIASYERTQVTGNSRYDEYETGGNDKALTEEEKLGLRLFRGKAFCFMCHNGFNFTDERWHRLGIGLDEENPDWGRFLVSKQEKDRGRFKTPSLRNVAETAPYMHDGSLKTLEDVVDFYSRGGKEGKGFKSEVIPLNLSDEEKKAIVSFLKTLTGNLPWRLP